MSNLSKIRRSMKSESVSELLALHSSAALFQGLRTGILLKNRKHCVVLCKNKPALRPNGGSECFETKFIQSNQPGRDRYMGIYIPTSSRLYNELERPSNHDIFLVHRLIAKLAKGSIPGGCEVHHINKNILDNRRSNLSMVHADIHREFHQLLDGQNAHQNHSLTLSSLVNNSQDESSYFLHVIYKGERNAEQNWLKRLSRYRTSVQKKMLAIVAAMDFVGQKRNRPKGNSPKRKGSKYHALNA